jgi:glycosyltransferase involved in cell wall biosynthesis
MLRNSLYYRLKPHLPWRLRFALRRYLARRKRTLYRDIWPITQMAAKKPAGWSGWPDGKQFAFILTHDVEGPKGLSRVQPLMELERSLGFRSVFNFIPEGPYRVPKDLRSQLTRHGFEVGVHDFKHDGRLYTSRTHFRANAERINAYLRDWDAVGFRSGFMMRNLEWLHDLNVEYDCSTFDTDPFEPQPDGVGTIFPFWVPSPHRQENSYGNQKPGYVELPYTLPQDSTLFLLFRERSIDIWKKKLDWIAQQGGMALLDVHPDYIDFQNAPVAGQEYPHLWYRELLEYVSQKYRNQFWHVLPRDVADFCSDVRPVRSSASAKRICMVAYSVYESDNRVMRYAETLAEQGATVEVAALKKNATDAEYEKVGSVHVHRLQHRPRKNQQTRLAYLLPVLKFCLLSSLWLSRRHLRRRFDLIHVHNVPDFLVFSAWLPKLTGAKVILDIHDILPEFYVSKFHIRLDSVGAKLLRGMERLCAMFADHVIISNHLWHGVFISRSAPAQKCSVMLNHVDSQIFFPRERSQRNGKFVALFPGGLQWHQGLDIAIKAFPRVLSEAPHAEFHIYGDGNMKGDLIALAQRLNLNGKVRFFDSLPIHAIADVMAEADLGVVPKRADSFGNEAYSTKIMEFMSLGVPVVISRTKIDNYYFDDTVVKFFESGNEESLAQAMLAVIRDPGLQERLIARGQEYATANNWSTKKTEYLRLVDSLTGFEEDSAPGTGVTGEKSGFLAGKA